MLTFNHIVFPFLLGQGAAVVDMKTSVVGDIEMQIKTTMGAQKIPGSLEKLMPVSDEFFCIVLENVSTLN